ncbi:MAG: DUF357 domain-containing protein [Methanocellales archaeon]|nr:DUF357 domain-containing protein [Methanocellales archaeon]
MRILEEKVKHYRGLLERAIKDVKIAASQPLRDVAEDYLMMARSYYRDGVHFQEKGDLVNALACLSYGHAWLDAGVRLGVFDVRDKTLCKA